MIRNSIRAVAPWASAAMMSLAGCASAVYDPSIQLPGSRMSRNELQATLYGGALPETRSDNPTTTASLGGALRFAVTDALVVGGRFWGTADGPLDRSGFAADAVFIVDGGSKPAREGHAFAVIPRAALVFDGTSLEGYGAGISFAAWVPRTDAYIALGAIAGRHDEAAASNEWGYGIVGNVGTSIQLSQSLSATIETAAVYQVNVYDDTHHFVLAPVIGLCYRFVP